MTAEGTNDAPVFHAFVTAVLVLTLQPVDIVVMDNLRAHKVEAIQTAIAARGAVPAAVFSRLVADRTLLVKTQNLLAKRQNQHA